MAQLVFLPTEADQQQIAFYLFSLCVLMSLRLHLFLYTFSSLYYIYGRSYPVQLSFLVICMQKVHTVYLAFYLFY